MAQRVCLIFCLWACTCAAQNGSMDGRVESSVGGGAIPGATVILTCTTVTTQQGECVTKSVKARQDGSFRFDDIAPGNYYVVAHASRFVRRPSVLTANLDANQQLSGLIVQLDPQASISGKVIDEKGAPVKEAAVVAFAERRTETGTELQEVSKTVTNESGEYTLGDITPGKYYVSAEKNRLHFYYPSAAAIDQTTPIQADLGGSYTGMNIRLQAITPRRVEGKIAGLQSLDGATPSLRLEPRSSVAGAPGQGATIQPDGTFVFAKVLPGTYILRLKGNTPLSLPDPRQQAVASHQLAKQDLDVGANDVLGVVITIPPPIIITGQVNMDGGDLKDVVLTRIILKPAEGIALGDYQTVAAQPDGTFRFAPCDAAKYSVHVFAPSGKYVQSIDFNGQDALAHLIDLSTGVGGQMIVTLAKGTAEFSGTIQGAVNTVGTASNKRLVVMIPANWSPEVGSDLPKTAASEGGFAFRNMAPGAYQVVALEWVDNKEELWHEPTFIQALQTQGQTFDLHAGDRQQAGIPLMSDDEVKGLISRLGLAR